TRAGARIAGGNPREGHGRGGWIAARLPVAPPLPRGSSDLPRGMRFLILFVSGLQFRDSHRAIPVKLPGLAAEGFPSLDFDPYGLVSGSIAGDDIADLQRREIAFLQRRP